MSETFDLTKMERMGLESTILDCLFDDEAETYDEDELRETKEQVRVISARITSDIARIVAANTDDLRVAHEAESKARAFAEDKIRRIVQLAEEFQYWIQPDDESPTARLIVSMDEIISAEADR